ncbi:MAG: phosphate ABC transporter substrate-binding protein PstS [Beijerinckiaceae bacterium]
MAASVIDPSRVPSSNMKDYLRRRAMRHLSFVSAAFLLGLAVFSPPQAEAQSEQDLMTRGAGSTFAAPVASRWARLQRSWKSDGADLSPLDSGVEYEAIGSQGGIVRVSQGAVDFGLTDAPLPAAELTKLGLIQFPVVMGGIVPAVNVQGIGPGTMRFTGEVLADIYLGKITNWSDAAIKALNPDLTMPDLKITVLTRQDGSGTTFTFAQFLSSTSAEWKQRMGADTSLKWPVGKPVEGSSGMTRALRDTAGAIGYIEYGQVARAALSYGLVRNRAGHFIRPDAASFEAAAASADWAKAQDFYLHLTEAAIGPQAYPIAATTFALMPRIASTRRLRNTLQFFASAFELGGAEASALGYVPLPEPLVKQVKGYWARTLKIAM